MASTIFGIRDIFSPAAGFADLLDGKGAVGRIADSQARRAMVLGFLGLKRRARVCASRHRKSANSRWLVRRKNFTGFCFHPSRE